MYTNMFGPIESRTWNFRAKYARKVRLMVLYRSEVIIMIIKINNKKTDTKEEIERKEKN